MSESETIEETQLRAVNSLLEHFGYAVLFTLKPKTYRRGEMVTEVYSGGDLFPYPVVVTSESSWEELRAQCEYLGDSNTGWVTSEGYNFYRVAAE